MSEAEASFNRALIEAAREHPQEDARSEDDWAAEVRATLDAAVARQMVSDVPLGSFLSGGVDSSILVSAMSRASSRPVKTFSIGFRNRSYDELPFARMMAAHCGTEHHEEILEPGYLDLLDDVVLAEARAHDIPVLCYTVNTEKQAKTLFARGVSALFTDRLDLFAQ